MSTPSTGFVRGDAERREIGLMDVLPPDLRGFSTQQQQEEFAAKYEKTTGVMVRMPWETDADREARRSGFQHFKNPEIAGDPVRLQRSLDRVLAEIANLTRDNPKFGELYSLLVDRAHKFERALGIKETEFGSSADTIRALTEAEVAGAPLPSAKAPDPQPTKEALEKFEAFRTLSDRRRLESAQATKDRGFLALIRDRESAPAVVEAATLRLIDLDRAAQTA